MGIFANSTPFDADVAKVTDEKNTVEDWGLIMDLCDRVQAVPSGPKDCLKAIMRRLNHQDPHVVIQAITLLDACVNNCGKQFMLEVSSREFEKEFRNLLGKSHPKIQDKLRTMLKKWAEGEFKSDTQLSLIPGLYSQLKKEGVGFTGPAEEQKAKVAIPNDPNVVSSQQEEDDIAKAIQLSLQENSRQQQSSSGTQHHQKQSQSLYPTDILSSQHPRSSSSGSESEQKKARALYDFEAAEDNELTFKAGEIVIVLDDSDANWWKGSNHRGEGLFPSNFVTTDLKAEPEQFKEEKRRRSVQFNDEVEIKTVNEPLEIDEEKIDRVLSLLHDADPTSPESDPPELPHLEEQANNMGPLIDAELEIVDRRHAQLTRLSTELVDALNLYHQLMRELPPIALSQPPSHMMYPGPQYPMQQQQQQQQPYMPPPQPPLFSGIVPPGQYPMPLEQQQHHHILPNGIPPHQMPYGPTTTTSAAPLTHQAAPQPLQQQQQQPPPQPPPQPALISGTVDPLQQGPPHNHDSVYTACSAPPPPTPPLTEQQPPISQFHSHSYAGANGDMRQSGSYQLPPTSVYGPPPQPGQQII